MAVLIIFLQSRFPVALAAYLLPTKSLCIDREKVGRRGDFGASLGEAVLFFDCFITRDNRI